MKILRLELFGFKAFKDKTIVAFDQPITAIVGSNGCGKSNIVDALYWVMGDMSPKHLRGSSMQDVIFSGSRDAAAMDMAEVTLVLERDPETDPQLPPQFQASKEIQITRRYYRAGESEYEINKTTCRLRDIQEFFMDTGLGAKAYSIIEQGAITRMVAQKPEDRRSVIEEVAGIMKFKARKAETERRIESTKTNVQRVDDILGDLQKQLSSLKRQADKAEKYKVFTEELKSLELHLAAREWVDRNQTRGESLLALVELQNIRDQLQTSVDEARIQIEAQSETLSQLEIDYSARHQETRTLELALKDIESQIHTQETKKESFEGRIQHNNHAIEELHARREELTQSLEHLLADIEAQELAINELSEKISASELEAENLRSSSESLRQSVQEKRAEKHQVEIEQTKLTQQIQTQQKLLSGFESKRESIAVQLESIQHEIGLKTAEQQGTLHSLEQAFATRSELESAKLGLDETMANVEKNKAIAQQTRDDLKEQLTVVSVRRSQLEALERDLSGVDAAAKELALGLRAEGQDQVLLADRIKVPSLLEKAIEATLGRNLQRVTAFSFDQVTQLKTQLSNSHNAEARQARIPLWMPALAQQATEQNTHADLSAIFVSVPSPVTEAPVRSGPSVSITNTFDSSSFGMFSDHTDITSHGSVSASPYGSDSGSPYGSDSGSPYGSLNFQPGPDGLVGTETFTHVEPNVEVKTALRYLMENERVVGPMSQLIRNDAQLSPEDESWLSLLSEFWVVRSSEDFATIVFEMGCLPVHLVSLDGDVLMKDGFLDLAAVEVKAGHENLGLVQRKREIQELREREQVVTQEFTASQDAVDRWNHELLQARESFRELTHRLAALNPDVERFATFLRQVEAQIARLSEKSNLLGEEQVSLTSSINESTTLLTQLAEELAIRDERRQAVSDELEQLEIELKTMTETLRNADRALSEQRNEAKTLEKTLAEIQSRRATSEHELTLSQTREVQLTQEIETAQQEIAELVESIETEQVRLSGQRVALEESLEVEKNLETQVEQQRQALKQLASQLDKSNSELGSVISRLKDVEQSLAINDVELRNLCSRLQEQYQVALDALSEDQIKDMSTPTDIEAMIDPNAAKEHVSGLRRKIEGLGKINMVAIEEYQEISKRYEYLFLQRQDLHDALAQLHEAIERINRESKERFGEAFHAVNSAFQKVFPLMFGGGTAELKLTNPDDLLETGVEIVAQPPGKKLQSVTLLSGGEKALTAVSLIFAIFSIKPSPFCVLDEVDAPLDDANVGRFNTMVRQMSKGSQIIMITHHKKSMESCDALFGVTMERPGISKVASVQLANL